MIGSDLLGSANFLQTWVRQGGPSDLCSRLEEVEGTVTALTTAVANILTGSVTAVESNVVNCTDCVRTDCENRVKLLEDKLDTTYATMLMDFHVVMSNVESITMDMHNLLTAYTQQQQQQSQSQSVGQSQSQGLVNNVNVQPSALAQSFATAGSNASGKSTSESFASPSNAEGGSPILAQQQSQQQLVWLVANGGGNVPVTLQVASADSEGNIPSGIVFGPILATAVSQATVNSMYQLLASSGFTVNNLPSVSSAVAGSTSEATGGSVNVNLTEPGTVSSETPVVPQETATAVAQDEFEPELKYDLSDDALAFVVNQLNKYGTLNLSKEQVLAQVLQVQKNINQEGEG